MYKQKYEDYKYVMQDTYQLYLGSKYTFQELVENDEVPFKFRLIIERYLFPDVNPDTTLESHFYYLENHGVLYTTYRHIKIKVKINIIEEVRTITGKRRKEYTTKVLPIEQLAAMTPTQKEEKGVVIQEIMCSKLALMTF